jgi:hypothetical protein
VIRRPFFRLSLTVFPFMHGCVPIVGKFLPESQDQHPREIIPEMKIERSIRE